MVVVVGAVVVVVGAVVVVVGAVVVVVVVVDVVVVEVVVVELVVVVVAGGVTVIDGPVATTLVDPPIVTCPELVVHTPLAFAEAVAVAVIDAVWPWFALVQLHVTVEPPGAEVMTHPVSGPVVMTPDSSSVPVVPPVTVSETEAGRPLIGAGGSMLNVAVTDVVPPAGMVVAPTVTVPLVTALACLGQRRSESNRPRHQG